MTKQTRKFWIICLDDEPMWAYNSEMEAKDSISGHLYNTCSPIETKISIVHCSEIESKSRRKIKKKNKKT